MNWLLRLLPQSLVERVFALYSLSLLTFILAGLGSFYYYQFTQAIDEAHGTAALTSEVIAPTITDSVVIGDYDTVHRTLKKVLLHSVYASAAFIDLSGGLVRAEGKSIDEIQAPEWLKSMVSQRLFDVNRNISAGGKDYGVLRLKFSPEHIAGDIWTITRSALAIAAACFLFGIVLIRIPLRRWLGNLDRIRAFEWELQTGLSNPHDLLSLDVPLEIRQTFDVLNRTATSLQIQRARADVTLGAIAEGVITADSQGMIVYANPVALDLFASGTESLIGQALEKVLPDRVGTTFKDLTQTGTRKSLVEIQARDGRSLIIECNWTQIGDTTKETAGYVLTCRDVTETHLLDLKLRAELDSRRTALDSLRNVINGVQGVMTPSDDIAAMSKFIEELSRERARVSSQLENSVRELGYQKFALDAHSIVTITDSRGTITYANDKFTEISGYGTHELIGQNHSFMKSGVHSEEFYRNMWDTIRAGRVWHGQIANRSKDGKIYWAASTIVPWLGEDGVPYQYIAIRTDITDQKKIEHALEEARRRELEIGTSIQRSLLQGEVPDGIEGAWLACFTEPSQGIDGDFYAIRSYHSACFEILVGDVMGKGVPAALIGAAIKTAYNEVLADLLTARVGDRILPTPAEIVNRLHLTLTPRLVDLSSFATLALYRFDLEQGTLTYVNAGHTPGLLTRNADGNVHQIMGDNLPIGVMPDEVYVQTVIAVEPGDNLMVFSDGITEARNDHGEEFGLERLCGLVRSGRQAVLPPATMLHSIRGELRRFESSDQLVDDQTALMVELHARRKSPRGHVEQRVNPFLFNLPWNLSALATLRARIEESAWHLPADDTHALVLASFEAGTNIIRHAPPLVADATLTCRVTRLENGLVVELIYPSTAFRPPEEMQPDFSGESEGGFGLYIIEESVDSVEYGEPMPGIGSIRLVKLANQREE